MAEVWLICEGVTDASVLRPIFTRVLTADISVEGAGGLTNLGAVANYVRQQRGGVVASVSDRDYRRKQVADDSYRDGRERFIWRRHSIENYLLHPKVIVEAFRQLRESMKGVRGGEPGWMSALPDNEEVVACALAECAAVRAPPEAGRITIFALWEDLSDTAGRVQKRVPDILGARSIPTIDECRQALVEEASRIENKAREASASPHLTPESISTRYDDIVAKITAEEYVSAGLFLEDYHGKDLLRQFQTWLHETHGIQLTLNRLIEELTASVPVVYAKDRALYGTDDFLDLANGVRTLAGLPPVP